MKKCLQREKCRGFTLTEVMVSLFIVSLLMPAILSTFIFFDQAVIDGVKRNQNLIKTRYFQEFFVKKLNDARNTTLAIADAGNRITFDMPTASNTWETATFQYRSDEKDLLFSYDGKSRSLLEDVSLVDGASSSFSKQDGVMRCELRVGSKSNQVVEVRITARARN